MEPVFVAVTMSAANGPSGPRGQLNAAYTAALEAAGLVPLLLAPHLSTAAGDAVLGRTAGLVLTGGGDIDPSLYGETPAGTEMSTVSCARDAQELALARSALDACIPLLAICRGMQVLNVALGGTLTQDIPSSIAGALRHRQEGDRSAPSHRVRVEARTVLADIIGPEVATNSLHHQAIATIGHGVVVTARSDDGVIEAIEVPGQAWTLGVQWHPEEMAPAHEHARRLFAAFAAACARKAERAAARP